MKQLFGVFDNYLEEVFVLSEATVARTVQRSIFRSYRKDLTQPGYLERRDRSPRGRFVRV